MPARKSSSAKRRLIVGTSLLPALALGACADYLKHSDTITSSAGNAMAHNSVVHTTDPWPPAAADTRIAGNGQRVDRITKRYIAGSREGSDNSAPTFVLSPAMNQSPDSSNNQPSQ